MGVSRFFNISILVFALVAFVFATPTKAQTDNEDLANALAEFEADEITAKDLGVDEPNVLPGDFGYSWQILKEKLGLFFTFDEEEKINKLEEAANRRLIEIQKLSETNTDNAADNIAQALERYRNTMQKVTDKLAANPNIKTKILENFDAKQLKHQEVLVEVTEKLKDKIPENNVRQLENVRQENIERLYQLDAEAIEQRLENAVEKGNLGQSKFNALRVLPTLEAIGDSLPAEIQNKVEAAKTKAEEILTERLADMNAEDQEKIEKYINNIKAPELIKQKVINTLENSAQLPAAVKEQVKNVASSYSQQMMARFKKMTTAQKEKFLGQFANAARSHPIYLDFLNQIDEPELQEKIQELIQIQEQGVKQKLQNTNSLQKLNSFENNASIKANPTLLKTLRDQQTKVEYEPMRIRQEMGPVPTTR